MARELVNVVEDQTPNRIINGGFDFAQRSGLDSAQAIGGGFAYQTADRWQIGHNAGDKTSQSSEVASSSGIPALESTTQSLLFRSDHTGPNGDLQCRHFIEADNIRDLAGKVVSFSVWVRSSSADTVVISLSSGPTVNTFTGHVNIVSESKTINNTETPVQLKVVDVLLPANVENGLAITIEFENFLNTGGQQIHHVAEAMLAEGSNTRPFRRASSTVAEELRLCQRYFEKTWDLTTIVGTASGDAAARFQSTNAGLIRFTQTFEVRKRTTPTVTVYNPSTGGTGTIRVGGSVNVAVSPTVSERSFYIDASSLANATCEMHSVSDAEIS